ncbi:hypothetical protein HY029_01105 [Candidatus Gottesmanbacteria bacterium]|nr:hypothetical protein [Candidatus Gottesmanbacteria bacterium]
MDNTPVVQTANTLIEKTPSSSLNYLKFIIGGLTTFVVFISGGLFLGKVIYSPKNKSSQTEITTSFTPVISPSTLPTESTVPTLSPTIMLISDPTINWQTYTYGKISFKYPQSFQKKPQAIGISKSLDTFTSEDSIYKLSFVSSANFSEQTGKPIYPSLEDIIKANSGHEVQRIMLDNHPAIKVLPYTISIGTANETVNSSVYTMGIEIISIEIKSTDQAKVKAGNEIFDQILSTFKFLN